MNNLCSNLTNNARLDNVTFIVGPAKEKIAGNRTVFALQSSVFEAMLFGNMIEAKSNEIVIDDVTPAAFKFLKDLFYRNEKPLNVNIVCDVLYACKKYILIDLECECYRFIENVDTLKDWWKLIQLQSKMTAKDIDMQDALIRKSKILINNSKRIAANIDELVKIIPQWVALTVESSSFVIEKEETVWEMCLNYCKNHTMQPPLSPTTQMRLYFVDHIRFPLISKHYLFKKIEPSGILTFETLYQILKCLDKTDNQEKYASKWKWYPRKPYYQRFLACYDIKLLKPGDQVYVARQCGRYLPEKIKNINWTPHSRSSFSSGIMFDSNIEKSFFYKNFSVSSLRKTWCLAMKIETWGNATRCQEYCTKFG